VALKRKFVALPLIFSPDDHTLILGKKIQTAKIHLTQKLQPELLHYQNWNKTLLITCGSHTCCQWFNNATWSSCKMDTE
jgi:hypothetical protein